MRLWGMILLLPVSGFGRASKNWYVRQTAFSWVKNGILDLRVQWWFGVQLVWFVFQTKGRLPESSILVPRCPAPLLPLVAAIAAQQLDQSPSTWATKIMTCCSDPNTSFGMVWLGGLYSPYIIFTVPSEDLFKSLNCQLGTLNSESNSAVLEDWKSA